jgi:hypothetical protein
VAVLDFHQQPGPIHHRHAHVRDHHVERLLGHGGQGLLASVNERHVPFPVHGAQHPLQPFENHGLVVDEEDLFLHGRARGDIRPGTCRRMEARGPGAGAVKRQL